MSGTPGLIDFLIFHLLDVRAVLRVAFSRYEALALSTLPLPVNQVTP